MGGFSLHPRRAGTTEEAEELFSFHPRHRKLAEVVPVGVAPTPPAIPGLVPAHPAASSVYIPPTAADLTPMELRTAPPTPPSPGVGLPVPPRPVGIPSFAYAKYGAGTPFVTPEQVATELQTPTIPIGQEVRKQVAKAPDDPSRWALNTLLDLGVVTGDVAEGLSTPVNLTILGGLALSGPMAVPALVTRLVSLGFSAQMANAAAQNISGGLDAARRGDLREAGRKFGAGGVDTVFSFLAGRGALRGEVAGPGQRQVPPSVKPEVAEQLGAVSTEVPSPKAKEVRPTPTPTPEPPKVEPPAGVQGKVVAIDAQTRLPIVDTGERRLDRGLRMEVQEHMRLSGEKNPQAALQDVLQARADKARGQAVVPPAPAPAEPAKALAPAPPIAPEPAASKLAESRARFEAAKATRVPPEIAAPEAAPKPRAPAIPMMAREPVARPTREPGPSIVGKGSELITPSAKLRTHYKVVEASDLIASHDPNTFAPNPEYPALVQERRYDLSKDAQQRVIQQAQTYDPSFTINTNPDAVNGPPIVTTNSTVLGGNSRVMSTQRIYREGKGDPYRNRLVQSAEAFGLKPEEVQKFKEPVLVRVLDRDPGDVEQARRVAQDLNRSFTGALGINERAVSAGRSITFGTLETLDGWMQEMGPDTSIRDVLREHPKQILAALERDRVITDRERPQFTDPTTGGFSEAGKNFVERALLGSVIDDVNLLENAPKSVMNKVEGGLANLARLKAREDEWDITPLVRESLRDYARMTASGAKVEDYLGQPSMFGPAREPAVDAMTRFLQGKKAEIKKGFHLFALDSQFDVRRQGTLGLTAPPRAAQSFQDWFGGMVSEEEYRNGIAQVAAQENLRVGRAPSVAEAQPSRGGELGQPAAGTEAVTPPKGKPPGPADVTELSANPVFNPRFWERANVALRPFTFNLERSIERVFGKLPFSIRRWFQEDPQLKRIMHEARAEVGVQRSETDAVLRMVLKDKPTREELVIADRIARGVPKDLSPSQMPLQESVGEAAEYAHRLAQEITSERMAMGLPVRSDWLEGPKHWYPNLWQQHVFNPRMIAGRLFGFFRKAGATVRPSAAEMGSLKARTTDRWVVVNSSGDVVKAGEGREAIFSKAEEAESFVAANSGYKVRYFPQGSRKVVERSFPTLKEREAWLKEQGSEIRIRGVLPGQHLRIVEPMTHEQMVAHGLIEDLALNLRYGFGKERALLAKARALQKLGAQLAIDTPQAGYVKLSETGFEIPAKLAERNSWIARLRDGYVPELVADGLNALYGRRGAWSNYFRAAEGTLRKWVTLYSPFRHPRNLIENYIPLAFRDPKAALDLPAMGVGFRDFVRAARGEKDVPFWQEFQGSGLASTDILRGEFETVWKTIDRVRPGNMELSVAERMGIWAETNPVARRLLKTRDFVQQMYRAEDQIWKYYYFRTLRERGWTLEAAAQRARRTFFDYEDVPPYVRAANRVMPFVPNITFQYARILLSALRDDPASAAMKLGLLMYGYAFVREKSMEAAGITEQDEKNMGRLGIKWHEFPVPITDDKGRNLIVNLQWLIPFSEVALLRYSAAEEEPERGLAQATRRFIPMIGQPVATAISQRGAFSQKILTGTETQGEAKWKMAREVVLAALPGLLGQYWDRLYKNAAAGPERKEPWGQTLAEGLVGNIQRLRPGERIELRKALIAGQGREVQEEGARQRGRLIRGATSAETFREEIGKLRERSGEEAAAHPETLAVVKALEEGRNSEAQAEYQKLKDSGFYANSEEAIKTIRDLLTRRGRLAELEKAPLAPARETVAAIVDEFRRTGRVNQGKRHMLKARMAALSESDQDAVLDYLEQQLNIAREERKHRSRESEVYPPAGLRESAREPAVSPVR
jgi:hypothetical protein